MTSPQIKTWITIATVLWLADYVVSEKVIEGIPRVEERTRMGRRAEK